MFDWKNHEVSCVFGKTFSLNKYEGKRNNCITSVIGNEQCLDKKG